MKLSRRALLGAASLVPLGAKAATVRRGVGHQQGGSGPTQLITTLTFVNDGSGTAPANVPTDWFGVNLKDAAVPAGGYFFLQLPDGTPQPFSSGGEAYYTSGALLHANVRMKPTFSLTTGTSQAVQVWSGGSVPVSSGRSLSELYAQGLQIRATIATQSPQPAPGGNAFWVAQIDAAHVIKTETWADGQAGLAVALWMNFYQANSSFVITGSAHGQFMCKLYVFLHNDGSNNFGGMSLLAALGQPKYNNDTPAKNTIALTAVTYHAGSTTINWPLTLTPFTFTQDGGDSNRMNGTYGRTCACVASGLSGSTLSTSALYFLVPGSGSTQFYVTTFSNLSNFAAGPVGNGTMTPVIPVMPFQRTYGLNSNADWVYIQGSGSIASSSIQPWRVQFDQTYFRNTRLIPPYDITNHQGTANGGTLPDSPSGFGPWYSSTWVDTNCSVVVQGLVGNADSATGVWTLSKEGAADFFNQSATSRNIVKFSAYAQGKLSVDLRDSTTLTPLNIIEANGTNTYTGFPNSVSTTVSFISYGGSANGFTEPPASAGPYIFEGNGTRHYPEMAYYAYLVLGRPELWDAQASMAVRAGLASTAGNDRNASTVSVGFGNQLWQGEERGWGHTIETIGLTSIIAPGKSGSILAPDGTNSVKYFRDWINSIAGLQVAQMNPGITGSYANTYAPFAANTPYWNLRHATSGSIQEQSTFQVGHLMHGTLITYAALGNSNLGTWLNYVYANKLHQLLTNGPWAQFSYYERNTIGGIGGGAYRLINSDAEYAQWGMHGGGTFWTAAGDATFGTHFSMSFFGPYTLTVGDGLFFSPANGGLSPSNVDPTHDFRVKAGSLHLISGPPSAVYKFDLEDLANPGVTIVPAADGSDLFSMIFHPYVYPSESTAGISGNVTMQYSIAHMYYVFRMGTFFGLTVDSRIVTSVNTIVATDSMINFSAWDTASLAVAST